jgi:hypothetical protein
MLNVKQIVFFVEWEVCIHSGVQAKNVKQIVFFVEGEVCIHSGVEAKKEGCIRIAALSTGYNQPRL